MRTDRQNKIYSELKNLIISLQSNATPYERDYLKEAKINIDEGKDFNRSINALNWNLKKVKARQEGLSSMVNDFYEKTTSYYGEPREDLQYIDWTDRESDPNMVYIGRGVWYNLNNNQKKNTLFYYVVRFIAFTLFVVLIFVAFFPFFTTRLESVFGKSAPLIVIIAYLITIMIILAITGRIKKK